MEKKPKVRAYGAPPLTKVCDPTGNINHGTAVLGVLAASHNDLGTSGIAPEADACVISEVTINGRETERAIRLATDSLSRGDILVIEAQVPGPLHKECKCGKPCDDLGLVPVEYEDNLAAAIHRATRKGIIVVEAAGNGSQDLDNQQIYGDKFNRDKRDSRAILVGAGTADKKPGPAPKTNYGLRVDLQAWGEKKVVTTGYGDLFPGQKKLYDSYANELYTEKFGGTSSATAIVAGAAAVLQGIWKARGNQPLSPTCLRKVLAATGVPQKTPVNKPIGYRPNLQEAIDAGLKNVTELCYV